MNLYGHVTDQLKQSRVKYEEAVRDMPVEDQAFYHQANATDMFTAFYQSRKCVGEWRGGEGRGGEGRSVCYSTALYSTVVCCFVESFLVCCIFLLTLALLSLSFPFFCRCFRSSLSTL